MHRHPHTHTQTPTIMHTDTNDKDTEGLDKVDDLNEEHDCKDNNENDNHNDLN